MDQKTRNRIAWALAVVLAPLMIYLLVDGVRKGRQRRHLQPQALEKPTPAAVSQPTQIQVIPVTQAAVSAEVLKEQNSIALKAPKRNPFAAPQITEVQHPPADNPPEESSEIKLSGIIYRKAPAKSVAIINGKPQGKGDCVGGWKIVAIGSHAIILDNGKEKITVEVQQQ